MVGECSQCGVSNLSLLACAACGNAFYCNPHCQKIHWKSHKKNCKAFAVKQLPGKGFGVISKRDISQGELLISEDPALVLYDNEKQAKIETLNKQFKALTDDLQKKVLSLYDSNPEGDEEQKIWRIFESNNIKINKLNAKALYPAISRFNHSCSPDVTWSWKEGNQLIKEVRALRWIPKGKEICVSYMDTFETNFNSKKERQKHLKKWGFTCDCKVCTLSDELQTENDNIRQEIGVQHCLIPEYIEKRDIKGALNAAKQKLDLMLKLEEEFWNDLPMTYMETYEMAAIAKAIKVSSENPDIYRDKAKELAYKFGDKFIHGFNIKLNEILYGC